VAAALTGRISAALHDPVSGLVLPPSVVVVPPLVPPLGVVPPLDPAVLPVVMVLPVLVPLVGALELELPQPTTNIQAAQRKRFMLVPLQTTDAS
jgi:hypothetical protein